MRLVPASHWPRFHIIRCGIEPGRFSPRPEPHNPVPRILCVGRLVPAKGQHVLVEACQLLFEKKIPFHLTLVGDGPDRDHLVKRVAELGLTGCIRFTGAVGQNRVLEYYRSADIFVLASFAEGLPVVLMEAMSMEIPCVTTWITGVPELITHDIDGLLVAPGDSDGLAMQLAHLLKAPTERARLGTVGRRRVLETYDLVGNCQKLVDLFTELNRKLPGIRV
jgi:glycosyltransferase involved in cell wall biosynthesis